MAYFVVQVQLNFEKQVLCNLTELLLRKKHVVKRIYALDTKIDFEKSINEKNIREYLKQSRLRSYFNNIRYAYYQFPKNDENKSLKEEYKKQIRQLAKEINKNYTLLKRNKELFIRGYIIIEVYGNFEQIPSDLYRDIKSIPKVLSIPIFNVPEEEIKNYFQLLTKRKRLIGKENVI